MFFEKDAQDPQSSFKARFEPELQLLIQLVLYKLSIWNTGASYGAKLQDLRYVVPSTSSKRLAREPLAYYCLQPIDYFPVQHLVYLKRHLYYIQF